MRPRPCRSPVPAAASPQPARAGTPTSRSPVTRLADRACAPRRGRRLARALLLTLSGLGAAAAAAAEAYAAPPAGHPAAVSPVAAQARTKPPAGSAGRPAPNAQVEPTLAPLPDGSGFELRRGPATLARIPLKTAALRRGSPRLRVVDIGEHAVAELRIPVRGQPREEVWIADIGQHPAQVLWNELAGPRDADGESGVDVAVSEDGVITYQTAAQVSRCDGQPVRLFPRAWDFEGRRFRPVHAVAPPEAGQTLTATRGNPMMPAARPMGGFRFTAASTTASAGTDAAALTPPVALDDDNPETVWAEGLGGDGRGEFLTARSSAGAVAVRGLRIVPGDARSPATFKAANRLKRIHLALGPEAAQQFEIAFPNDPAAAGDARAPYWVALPAPVETACLTLAVREVYRGTQTSVPGGGGTTAISDVAIFTDMDGDGGLDKLIARSSEGGDCGSRVPLLIEAGDRAVLPLAQAILTAQGVGRGCLVEALAGIPSAADSNVALDALAAALTRASQAEESAIVMTFRKAKTPPVRAVADLLASPKASADDRARAARVLGRLDAPAAAAALLERVGAGPGPVRLAVVQALASAPGMTFATLTPALATAGEAGPDRPRRSADLLRVLGPLARREPESRPAAVAILRETLAAPTTPFEPRARAIMTMGVLGGADVVPALARQAGGAKEPLIRYFAARELGALPDADGVPGLRHALSDHDPRVREAAALGLGLHRDRAAEPLLIKAAKAEPWPFVRRAHVEALARLCGAPARDLIVRAVYRDVDEVARAALAGLVRCRDPRAKSLLLATLKKHTASAPRRELSAALLGELGKPRQAGQAELGAELARTLGALVNEAEGDLAIEGVAVATLRTLGVVGGPDAAAAAARLALDQRHPYQQAAIEVLGQLCDPGPGAVALGALRVDKNPALSATAAAAAERCKAQASSPAAIAAPSPDAEPPRP